MRKPKINMIRDFLKDCKKNNIRVFNKSQIIKSVRDELLKNENIFSPYDNIYVLKKSDETKKQAIKNNLPFILEKLWWIISWEFALNYFLERKKNVKEILIYHKTRDFVSYLDKEKEYKIVFRRSKIERNEITVKFDKAVLKIESPLSFIINNIKKEKDNKLFQEYLDKVHFSDDDIVSWLIHKYKLSWLSRLAIYMKNVWRNWQYLVIKNTIESAWKKLDRRWNRVNIIKKEKVELIKNTKTSYDELM